MTTDRTEFLDAARAQAFTVTDPESADYGRSLVHSMRGSFGADWDLDGVIAAIESADTV
ncbi:MULTISPECIES: hypothetical protein [unclassified Nocardia]|uniref:hypothetical protein n=1 Tax=unclassified Nocardia TaxID=2637762 RepID=UPI00278BEDCF|nr:MULTISPECIES: hypothetical protein [unclassified Nocardia]